MSQLPFREQLEKHNNPEEVRQRLAAGNYNKQHADIAREYLASIDRRKAEDAAKNAEFREEETLAIAKEALAIARDANRIAKENLASAQASAKGASDQARWAMWAAILAVIATIVAAREQLLKLMTG